MPIETKIFVPVGRAEAVGATAVPLALVGEIVADVVDITVVGNGTTEGFPPDGSPVFMVPVVAGATVGESVGVIDLDERVSANIPGTDCWRRPDEPKPVLTVTNVDAEEFWAADAIGDAEASGGKLAVAEVEPPSANTPAADTDIRVVLANRLGNWFDIALAATLAGLVWF